MTTYLVKDLMVPLSEYATVPKGSTLFDAVTALEKAQEEFDHTKYRHRAVLILDQTKQVIGKLTQMDVLRALEPTGESSDEINALKKFGFSDRVILQLKKKILAQGETLKDICTKALKLKVEDFMQALSEEERVEESTTIDAAIQQLLSGNHFSLLATCGKSITGILRLSDVFAAVFHIMKECDIK